MRVGDWRPFGQVPEISVKELQKKLEQGAIQIVDVRTGPEFRRSRIPEATHLPITAFSRHRLDSLELDRERPVVAICLTAHRSIPAVRKLRELGYDARQLRGGMRAWWKGGGTCTQD